MRIDMVDITHSSDREVPLSGGHLSRVVRAGGTVRRPSSSWSAAVHRLLVEFARLASGVRRRSRASTRRSRDPLVGRGRGGIGLAAPPVCLVGGVASAGGQVAAGASRHLGVVRGAACGPGMAAHSIRTHGSGGGLPQRLCAVGHRLPRRAPGRVRRLGACRTRNARLGRRPRRMALGPILQLKRLLPAGALSSANLPGVHPGMLLLTPSPLPYMFRSARR